MAKIIIAPNLYSKTEREVSLFLAGDITNCPDWQDYLSILLRKIEDLVIYNPRRSNFPVCNPNASKEQIKWEYDHLKKADIISFWFSHGSDNPIVLYELGKWCNSEDGRNKITVIGIDPNYSRKQDVIIQTQLVNSHKRFANNLNDFAEQIRRCVEFLQVVEIPSGPVYNGI
jgi:hypothetical protein